MNTKTQKNRIENGFEGVKQLQRTNGNHEASETEELPRIVITADDVVMLPSPSGKTLSLSREEIDCIVKLTQALRRNIE